jgi:hypothetical protein
MILTGYVKTVLKTTQHTPKTQPKTQRQDRITTNNDKRRWVRQSTNKKQIKNTKLNTK